jgi:fructokinase
MMAPVSEHADGSGIVVAGEALVDLVIQPDGSVAAALGGGPFNTARACGRLGAPVAFAGALSNDRFGSLIVAQLAADGVALDLVEHCQAPTTLAAAELDEHGAATYRFYVDGTSAPSFEGSLKGAAPAWLFTGGLALTVEPMATTVERMVATSPVGCAVMIDVNARPAAVADRALYVQRLHRVVASADVVKASDDDLGYVYHGVPPAEAARRLLDSGARAVLLTAGGGPVRLVTLHRELSVGVPSVNVVDTIGAGDTFNGGFLAWWVTTGRTTSDLDSIDILAAGVEAGVAAAAIACTRRGADPPWRHELDAEGG